MGRKQNQQKGHKSFKKSGNIHKKNNYEGNSKHQARHDRRFNKIQSKEINRQEKKPDFNKGKENKNKKKGGLGQFDKMVGKSLFKIVPEGEEENQDKFAALNGQQDEGSQYEQQIQNEVQQQENEHEIQQNEEENEQNVDNQQYPNELDENQFEGDLGQEQNDENLQQNENQGEQANENQKQENEGQMEEQDQQDKNIDISVINLKIQQTLQVLMSLPKLGQGKPRKYHVDKLKRYLHRYYGYNFQLIDHFLNFLNPAEMVQFFEANQTQRPLTIRTNTLKTRRKQLAQALIQRGVNLDPLAEWSKVGIKIYETKVPIGATPEYLAGQYMLQSASSFLPVLALDPQMNEKILDLASAPGGKTSYIAQLMKNTGAVFANDLKKDRLKALQFNMYRLGITNTVVTCRDGRKYPEIFPNTFDRVLLDAPCTGLGIISKDSSIKANRVLMDIYKNSHVQKQLLLAAIDCTKVGGVIVYSTCSVSPLENEEVINYALKKRYVKIVDIDDLVEVGDPGITKFIDKRYHVDLRKTKRIYPHVHNMDGFYLGKLVKIANGKKVQKTEEQQK